MLGHVDLAVLLFTCVVWVAVPVACILGRRRQPQQPRLMWVGLQLVITGAIFSQYAHVADWSRDGQLIADAAAALLALAGLTAGVFTVLRRTTRSRAGPGAS
jgi:hypothetical protein